MDGGRRSDGGAFSPLVLLLVCALSGPSFPVRSGTTLAPLPATRRGYGIVLNASPKDQKIIYTNGRLVIVRSLEVRSTNAQWDPKRSPPAIGPSQLAA